MFAIRSCLRPLRIFVGIASYRGNRGLADCKSKMSNHSETAKSAQNFARLLPIQRLFCPKISKLHNLEKI
jgi:hypothetical protein